MAEMKNEIERMKLENQLAITSDQLDHKVDQLEHKKDMNMAELVLAQNAEEVTAIASPNG